MLKYTIYTENTPQLVPLLDRYLESYTIQIGVARWQGQSEQSATVTYLTDTPQVLRIKGIARAIITECNQNEVWFTVDKVDLKKVTRLT